MLQKTPDSTDIWSNGCNWSWTWIVALIPYTRGPWPLVGAREEKSLLCLSHEIIGRNPALERRVVFAESDYPRRDTCHRHNRAQPSFRTATLRLTRIWSGVCQNFCRHCRIWTRPNCRSASD